MFSCQEKQNQETRKATGMKPSNVSKRSTSTLLSLLGIYLALSPALSGQEVRESLTLEKAVSMALDGNDLIKAVHAEIDASTATVRTANSNYLPRVNYDYSISRGNNPVFVFGSKLTQNRF